MLDAKGAYLVHPERKPKGEPKPKGKLSHTAPKHLTDDQKLLWRELLAMIPPGVAFNSDKWALEELVVLKDESRKKTISDAAATRLKSYLVEFGLTPVARTRVTVAAEPESKLQAFLTKKPPKIA
jgi:hypothetical protein